MRRSMGLERVKLDNGFVIEYDRHSNQLFVAVLLMEDGRVQEVNRAEITPADLILLGVKICPST